MVDAIDVGIAPMKRTDIEGFFATLDKVTAVDRLARINCALGVAGPDDAEFQVRLARQLWRPGWIDRLTKAQGPRLDGELILFSVQHLGHAIKLALCFGKNEGGLTLITDEMRFLLGHSLLSLESAYPDSFPPPPPESDILERLHTAQMIARRGVKVDQDRASKNAYFANITRDLLSQDFGRKFEEEYKITPQECFTALFAVNSHFNSLTPRHVVNLESTTLDLRRIFGQCRIPRRIGKVFKEHFSFDVGDPAAASKISIETFWNTGLFRERPYCFLADEKFTGLDAEACANLLVRGLFNMLLRLDGGTQAERLYTQKGRAFEAFASGLLQKMQATRQSNGARLLEERAFCGAPIDGGWIEGSHVVICEFKSGLVKTKNKYGVDPSALADELDRKFIFGTERSRKGLSQISHAIEQILRLEWRPPGVGYPCIWPLLIVEDEFVCFKAIQQYISARSGDLFAAFPETVRQPQIISIFDLMMMNSYAHTFSPVDFLIYAHATKMAGHLDFNSMMREMIFQSLSNPNDLPVPLHENDFVDVAYRTLKGNLQHSGAPKCACGKDFALSERPPARPQWVCQYCVASNRPATKEEEANWRSRRDDDIAWYDASEE